MTSEKECTSYRKQCLNYKLKDWIKFQKRNRKIELSDRGNILNEDKHLFST